MFCSGLHFLRLFMHEANSCNRKFGQKHPVRPQTLATEKGATSKRIKNYEWTARIWRPHELTSKLESATLSSQVMGGRDRWKPTKRGSAPAGRGAPPKGTLKMHMETLPKLPLELLAIRGPTSHIRNHVLCQLVHTGPGAS